MPVPVAKTLTGQPYSIAFSARGARAVQCHYARVNMTTQRLVLCAVAVLATACTRVVNGTVAAEFGVVPNPSGVDVERVLLDQSRMQAITGGDEHLTVIPSMDASSPVDIDTLARTAPPECRFVYADTATFGPDIEAFHKTTFQDPPHGGLISEGAAAYSDADTAGRAFAALVTTVRSCADSSAGFGLVGSWNADDRSLQTRPGDCGRDYLLKSVVLVEVTYCGFPDSVSTIVMSNIAANLLG
jgi:PknH-like extracellular domain